MKNKVGTACLLALLLVPTLAQAAKSEPIRVADIDYGVAKMDYKTLNDGDVAAVFYLTGTGIVDCMDNPICAKMGLNGMTAGLEQEILMRLGGKGDGLFDGKAGTTGLLTIGKASVVFQGKGITEAGGCTTGIHQFMAMITEAGGCTTGIDDFKNYITEAGGCTTGVDQFVAMVNEADICTTGLEEFMAMITEAGGCTTGIYQFLAMITEVGGCTTGIEQFMEVLIKAGGCTEAVDPFIARIIEYGGCTTGVDQFMSVDLKLHTESKKMTQTLTAVFNPETGSLEGFAGEITVSGATLALQ
jgi:hypothetical protein